MSKIRPNIIRKTPLRRKGDNKNGLPTADRIIQQLWSRWWRQWYSNKLYQILELEIALGIKDATFNSNLSHVRIFNKSVRSKIAF